VVACRPAPNGGPFLPPGTMGRKKEKKLLKKMDPAIAGHPVFMLIAYPSKRKDGNRQKMILYFHIPPKREDPVVPKNSVASVDSDSEKNPEVTRRQRQVSISPTFYERFFI